MGCETCYTCEDIAEQQVNIDCDPLIGVIPEALLYKCGITILDPSDETEIAPLIASGDAVVYKNLKILVNAPSEVSFTSLVAGEVDGVSTYDRTASWIDGNLNSANIDAYNQNNSSNGVRFGGAFLYFCETEQVKWIDSTLQMVGGDNDVENEQSKWEGELRWRAKGDPTLHVAPPGIFGA
ncbi:hypothetical protein DRO66_00275 [Candidatus Bathyarchaeota archaeon]|nr:MAG: hypothetical protein DRO66_00275 [Candidatus Bathyarchaeota archaeon]